MNDVIGLNREVARLQANVECLSAALMYVRELNDIDCGHIEPDMECTRCVVDAALSLSHDVAEEV